MSTKNVPPYVAHFDGNQVPSMMGVEGTLGTADAGGTARPVPVGVNPITGAMYVQDLSGASGTTNVQIVGGTFNAGTVTTTLALNSGTINDATITALPDPLGSVVVTAGTVTTTLALNTGTITTIAAGTQNTLGTIGTVIGVGTVTNLGSITNIGTLPQVSVGTIPQVSVGTLPTLNLTTGTITTGSLSNVANLYNGSVNILTGTLQSSGTTTGVGVVTSITNLVSGTLLNSGTTTGVGVVTNLTSGSVRMTIGTITTGSITNVANVLSITAGTQNTLGTVGVVNNIVTGTLASVRQDYRPVGSSVITKHTLGTGGGTFFGTILAPSGAGTSVYLAGLSIVGRSGTVDCGISNNVVGSTGIGVFARGFFPPSGGIARTFNPAINLGTNGTIAYFLITAGTVDLDVEYWVGP